MNIVVGFSRVGVLFVAGCVGGAAREGGGTRGDARGNHRIV